MRGWALCVFLLFCSASARVRAQDADRAFCGMRAGVSDEGLQRVGAMESGRTGQGLVVFSREVVAGSRYLVLLGLSAPPSAVAFEPARIVGAEAPFRAGGRVALDFLALDAGELTISLSAPEGTRFHAAVFALVTPRAGRGALGARPAAVAIHALAPQEAHVYADCEPGVAWRASAGAVQMRGGTLSAREVAATVEGTLDAITRCAEADDRFTNLTLVVVVGPDGAVQTASGFGDGPFGACVSQAVRGWRFSPPRGGYIALVSVPITFGR